MTKENYTLQQEARRSEIMEIIDTHDCTLLPDDGCECQALMEELRDNDPDWQILNRFVQTRGFDF